RRRAILCQNVSSGLVCGCFFLPGPRGTGRIGTKFLASYFLLPDTCHRHPRSITPCVPNLNCRQFQSCPVKRAIARRVSPDPT
ncbi:unnamed protein product, partial [Plutella xylostella]